MFLKSTRYFSVCYALLMCLGSMASMNTAQALQLTAAQLQMVQQLPASEKAKLAQQVGVPTNATGASTTITAPANIPSRTAQVGRIEQQVRQPTIDQKQTNAAVNSSMTSHIPVAQIASQKGADNLEVRNAFLDFFAESKPLTVDTSNLKQFGYDLFAGSPSTFAPVTDVPVPAEYVLGPGDELKVQLFGSSNDSFSLLVDRTGEVSFPNLGPVVLAKLTFSEAKAFLAQRIAQKMVGVSASISMGKLRSIRIFALGEVFKPGSYVVSGLATLSQALMVSGGVNKTGSLRRVQLKRRGHVIATIDLYDFLLKGDTSKDVRLLPGDVVFVPPIGATVSIAGSVLRPAIYELKKTSNVGDLLRLSGGLLPEAFTKKALLEGLSAKKQRYVKDIDLEKRGLKARLHDGDLVKVFSTLDFEKNPVYLIGNVKRPGKYAWKKGMLLSDLIHEKNDLLPETYMNYALIEREAKGNREPEMVKFSLKGLFRSGSNTVDIELNARDKIYVFNRSYFRVAPKASISGSVKSPGEYELKKNMTILDLVMASGGLTRDSLMSKAELYRTDPVSKKVNVLSVNLAQVMKTNPLSDLLLQDLDRVVVHSVWEVKKRYQVRISGEVKDPGEYLLADGLHLSDLIFAAGNVSEKAYMKKVEITRYKVVDGEKRVSKHFNIDLNAALHGDEKENLELQPYDTVYVRTLTNWRGAEHVTFTGEVRFPGDYPIEDGEHLSDVLKRAGGYTDTAYLRAGVFTRETIRESQQKKIDVMAKKLEAEIARLQGDVKNSTDPKALAAVASAKAMLDQMKKTKATGRLVISLNSVKKLKDSGFDVTLHDGDTLYIPKRPDEILVMGQVYNNTAMLYQNKLSVDDYISRAGGVTRTADESRMYVVHASGLVEPVKGGWHKTKLYPGDAIVVPESLEQFNLLGSLMDWSKVMYQFGTALASMRVVGLI